MEKSLDAHCGWKASRYLEYLMGNEPVGALQQPSKAPVHGAHTVAYRSHWPQRLTLIDRCARCPTAMRLAGLGKLLSNVHIVMCCHALSYL